MFDLLDDPVPFRPTDDFRQRVVTRARRLRRRRRLAAAVGTLTVAVSVMGAGGLLYVEGRDRAIERVDVAAPASLDEAVNILVVGLDRREPSQEGTRAARTDTLAVVRVRPDGTVGVLGIPRDLIDPATGQQVNAAYGDGGPQHLIDVLHATLGIPVDHYVELDFPGFIGLVDDLGGVEVRVERHLVDAHSGLSLEPSECSTLGGETALALVRSRHVEGDTGADLSRIARNNALLEAVTAQLGGLGDDPLAIDRVSRTLADHAVLDDELSLGRLVELGRAVAAAGPGGVEGTTLPVAPAPSDPNRLEPSAGADAVLADFGATSPPARSGARRHDGPTLPGAATDPGIAPC